MYAAAQDATAGSWLPLVWTPPDLTISISPAVVPGEVLYSDFPCCIELEGVAGVPVDEGNLTRIPIPAGGKPHFAPIDSDGDTASNGSHFVAIFAHERSGAAVFTKVVGWYVK